MSARVSDEKLREMETWLTRPEVACAAAELLELRALDVEPRPLTAGDEYATAPPHGVCIYKFGAGYTTAPPVHRLVRIPIPAAAPESAPAPTSVYPGLGDKPLTLDEAGGLAHKCFVEHNERNARSGVPSLRAPAEKAEPWVPKVGDRVDRADGKVDGRIVGFLPTSLVRVAWPGGFFRYETSEDAEDLCPHVEKEPTEAETFLGRAAPEPVEYTITALLEMVRAHAAKVAEEEAATPKDFARLEARVTCLEHGHVWGAQVVYACDPPRLAPRTCTRCGRREVHVTPVAGGWQVQP